jgi:hypothetical protein
MNYDSFWYQRWKAKGCGKKSTFEKVRNKIVGESYTQHMRTFMSSEARYDLQKLVLRRGFSSHVAVYEKAQHVNKREMCRIAESTRGHSSYNKCIYGSAIPERVRQNMISGV